MRMNLLLRWLSCFAACLGLVFLLSFATGHKLYEGGNTALLCASVSLILGTVVFHFAEENRSNKAKIKELEERVKKLEGK